MAEDPANLEQLLDRFCSAPERGHKVTVGAIVAEVGSRSFGPLLLFAGVILASPLSGIPGMPTTMGVLVLTMSVQLLLRRDHFWLPRWLLKRSVSRRRIDGAVRWLGPPARLIDRFIRPRLTFLVRGAGQYVVAVVCTLLALCVPLLEVVPFSASAVGVALTAFGLALTARDGVLALVAFGVTAGTVVLVVRSLL